MRRLAVLLSLGLVVGCGAPPQEIPDEWQVLHGGVYSDRPVSGARVNVTSLVPGDRRPSRGQSGPSDDKGEWSVNIGPFQGPVVMEAAGGGLLLPLQASIPWLQFQEKKPHVTISPITHLEAAYSRYLIGTGMAPREATEMSEKEISAHFGDILHKYVAPTDLKGRESEESLYLGEQAKSAYIIGGLVHMAKRISGMNTLHSNTAITWAEVLQALTEDVEADGKFDGQGRGGLGLRLGFYHFDADSLRAYLGESVIRFAEETKAATNVGRAEIQSLAMDLANGNGAVFTDEGRGILDRPLQIQTDHNELWCSADGRAEITGTVAGEVKSVAATSIPDGTSPSCNLVGSPSFGVTSFACVFDSLPSGFEGLLTVEFTDVAGHTWKKSVFAACSNDSPALVLQGGTFSSPRGPSVSWGGNKGWPTEALSFILYAEDMDVEEGDAQPNSAPIIALRKLVEDGSSRQVPSKVFYRYKINDHMKFDWQELAVNQHGEIFLPLVFRTLLPESYRSWPIEKQREKNYVSQSMDEDAHVLEFMSSDQAGHSRVYEYPFFMNLRTKPVQVTGCAMYRELQEMAMLSMVDFHMQQRSVLRAGVSWGSIRDQEKSLLPPGAATISLGIPDGVKFTGVESTDQEEQFFGDDSHVPMTHLMEDARRCVIEKNQVSCPYIEGCDIWYWDGGVCELKKTLGWSSEAALSPRRTVGCQIDMARYAVRPENFRIKPGTTRTADLSTDAGLRHMPLPGLTTLYDGTKGFLSWRRNGGWARHKGWPQPIAASGIRLVTAVEARVGALLALRVDVPAGVPVPEAITIDDQCRAEHFIVTR